MGDPTHDALQHLLNCDERLTADPLGLIRRMADLLELDVPRLTLWLFARCVQVSMDEPRLRCLASVLGARVAGFLSGRPGKEGTLRQFLRWSDLERLQRFEVPLAVGGELSDLIEERVDRDVGADCQ